MTHAPKQNDTKVGRSRPRSAERCRGAGDGWHRTTSLHRSAIPYLVLVCLHRPGRCGFMARRFGLAGERPLTGIFQPPCRAVSRQLTQPSLLCSTTARAGLILPARVGGPVHRRCKHAATYCHCTGAPAERSTVPAHGRLRFVARTHDDRKDARSTGRPQTASHNGVGNRHQRTVVCHRGSAGGTVRQTAEFLRRVSEGRRDQPAAGDKMT